MSTTLESRPAAEAAPVAKAEPVVGTRMTRSASIALAVTRISLGFIFLWAFLDKLLGLGKATPAARAWLEGGSPTSGFLKGVTGPDSVNPLKDVYSVFVGHSWADWLFMIGLLGIGLALILGIGMRVAAVSGTVLMLMMYGASLPIATNPFLDDHIIYAMVMIVLALTYAGDTLGLGKVWGRTALVQKLPVLR